MALELVPVENAKPIRRPRNSQVTLINQSATDVFFDFNAARLNSAAVGAVGVNNGTKLVNTNGSIQIDMHERDVIFVRANTATQIDVQP